MKDQLRSDMKAAMKAKEKLKLSTIRSLISAIEYEEVQKKVDSLSETDAIAIIKSEAKKRKEAMEYLEKNGDEAGLNEAKEELTIIEGYFPSQLSEDRLKEILTEFKSSGEGANMGQAMGHLKQNFPGQYDGKTASQIAKEIFA